MSVVASWEQRVNALRYCNQTLQQLGEQRAEHQLGNLFLCVVEVKIEVRRHYAVVAVAVLQNT